MSYVMVFDFDDVIVDSRDAVRESYEMVGVSPPDDFWGRSADEWLLELCDGDTELMNDTHDRKNKVYASLVAEDRVPLLPGGEALKWFRKHTDIDVVILTAASFDAVKTVNDYHKLTVNSIVFGRAGAARGHHIDSMLAMGKRPIVIDDNLKNKEHVRGVPFVHVTDGMIRNDIIVEAIKWTL